MAEETTKKPRPTVSTNQIRKFEYESKASVVQFDVKFPEVIDRTYVVRLEEPFTDQQFKEAVEVKREAAVKQKQLNEAAKEDVQQRLDRVYGAVTEEI